jgi:hypothetical protein
MVLPRQSNRWEDSQTSVLAALNELEGWAYITHDDTIVVRPCDWIAPSNRGPLALYKNRGSYYDRARKVGAWLKGQGHRNPLNFNVHSPFLVDAGKYVEAARMVERLPAGFRASVYGNVYGLKTRKVIDPKVSNPGLTPPAGWPIWSLSDRSFERGLVGREVKQVLSDPGPYDG